MTRYGRVILKKVKGKDVREAEPARPWTSDYRIVSHYGGRDWSAFGTFEQIMEQWEALPVRSDGYFLLVEG